MKNNERTIPDSIRDNAFFKAVAERFPDGEWEIVQSRDEGSAPSIEPVQWTESSRRFCSQFGDLASVFDLIK